MAGNVTADLIRALIDNVEGPSVDWDGWESLAIILEFPDGEFNEAHGYLYSPDGVISAGGLERVGGRARCEGIHRQLLQA